MSETTNVVSRAAIRTRGGALTQERQLAVLFFFSGFAALLYQLVWQRSLFRILGVNIEAVTLVVTAFMVGLGLGSIAGGVVSKRIGGRAVLLLAVIETATGVFGLFSLPVFEAAGGLAVGAPLAVTALVALALVLVPTLLMGATLPVLVAHAARVSGLTGQAVGQLYCINAIGAAVACLAGAVVLFPFLGMSGSIWFAVAVNAGVAVFALRLHRVTPAEPAHPAEAIEATHSAPALRFEIMLALGALGGFVSLSYEIFFVRVMSFASGGLANAFALTLGCYLVGIASGSRTAGELHAMTPGRQAARIRDELLLAAIVGLLMLPVLARLGVSRELVLGVSLAGAFLLARAWGLLLPFLAGRGVAADADAGAGVSWLYAANIAGSAAGSLVTGFVLMDALSLPGIAQVLGVISLAAIVAFSFATRTHWRGVRCATGAIFAVAACAALPALSAGIHDRLLQRDEAAAHAVVEVVENRSGIIAVTADGTLYGDGMYDGRFNTDLVDDINGIVRPFALSLLHDAPRRVLMIGLASGSWARVIASHPQVESLKVIEINPGYAELAFRHAPTASLRGDPKIEFIDDDGRRWLRAHPYEKFDMIVVNTTYHYRANATNLLSREFLRLVGDHLEPGGVHFYNTTMSDRVQATGCETAPEGLRFTNHMALARAPMQIDFSRWRRVLLAYRIDGRAVLDLSKQKHRDKLDKLMAYEADWKAGRGLEGVLESCASVMSRTAGKTLVTDDNMGTEWRAPLGLE